MLLAISNRKTVGSLFNLTCKSWLILPFAFLAFERCGSSSAIIALLLRTARYR